MPELKDMTYQQMLDYCTWQQIQDMARGVPLVASVTSTANIVLAWQRHRAASQAAEGERNHG